MIFSEIYSSYFNTVAAILNEAVNDTLDKNKLYDTIHKYGFGESMLNIPGSMEKDWQLITKEYKTPLQKSPSMPLTTLQKRWLKAILNDKRIKLFGVSDEGLKDTQPLFDANTFVYFDRYSDGDNFEDMQYIKNFQIILKALNHKKALFFKYKSRSGEIKEFVRLPYKLEYSSKDDKFRLITMNRNTGLKNTFNLNRIVSCKAIKNLDNEIAVPTEFSQSAVMIITDERNTLERAMMSFSHFKKESEKLDDTHYKLTIHYDKDDETEILIRILSFGPTIRLLSPDCLLEQLKNRILKQKMRTD